MAFAVGAPPISGVPARGDVTLRRLYRSSRPGRGGERGSLTTMLLAASLLAKVDAARPPVPLATLLLAVFPGLRPSPLAARPLGSPHLLLSRSFTLLPAPCCPPVARRRSSARLARTPRRCSRVSHRSPLAARRPAARRASPALSRSWPSLAAPCSLRLPRTDCGRPYCPLLALLALSSGSQRLLSWPTALRAHGGIPENSPDAMASVLMWSSAVRLAVGCRLSLVNLRFDQSRRVGR